MGIRLRGQAASGTNITRCHVGFTQGGRRRTMLRFACVVLVWLGGTWTFGADDHRNLDAKDAFTKGFPQFLAFRGEYVRSSRKDYAAWCESVSGASGVIRKFVFEELPGIHPESHEWANRYAADNPKVLMLLHLNGEARQVMDFPDVHQRYFPGHWVYEPGSLLTAGIDESDTELQLQDAKPFKVKGYVNREKDGSKSWFPQHLLLVRVDERGERQWYESEYAILEGVDYKRKTITVKRGCLFTKPRAHGGGKTCALPLAGGVWGGKPMWFYNLSSVCPKDRNGRTAADAFVAEIAEWFARDGRLRNFNGIAFDVNYFEARHPSWDVDNDGKSDSGFAGGRNVWMEGDWHFLTKLRETLGENLLITADGQHEENQRAVGVLDGIESEGLVQHNDGFRGFSRTVNTHLYWQRNNTRKHDLRYIVLKLMNPADEKRGEQLRRFATGTACCLGALVTDTGDPALPEAFAKPGALGFPQGDLIRLARNAPDLLKGSGKPVALLPRLKAEGCSLRQDAGPLLVRAEEGTPAEPMRVTLQGVEVPAGDLTLFVEMEALDPLEGFTKETRVPRAVRARFSKVPDYGEGRYNACYADLYGYIGTHGPSVLSFYLRRPGVGAERMDVTFEIQGRGRAALRSLTAHSAPDVLVRAFDRGVVVVNPALEPTTVPVAELLPQVAGLPTSVDVPALDARFLNRP